VVTYNIIIEVTNPDELLKPGMTAQTRIVVASKPDVLRIPTAALRFRPDEDAAALKKKTETKSADGSKVAASSAQTTAPATPAAEPQANTDAASDDGVLSGMRAGARVFRVYTVGPNNTPKQHDVTIGISNTRFTELASGDLKAGDAVITRSLAPANTSGPN
jgi:HlyD family secretion protein